MAKKTTPVEEPVEVNDAISLEHRERESRAPVVPTFEDAAQQGRQQVADSSQNVSTPRNIAVSGSDPRMRRDVDQERLLRAVPAVPEEAGKTDVAEVRSLPSAFSEQRNAPEFPPEPVHSARSVPDSSLMPSRAPEEPVETGERMVTVNPRTTFDCVIGNNRWYFKKEVRVKVPESVREVLARAEAIFP